MKLTLSSVDDKHSHTKPVTVTTKNVWVVGNTVHIVRDNWRVPYASFLNGAWYLCNNHLKPFTRMEIE